MSETKKGVELDAIKSHKPQQHYVMRGPDGSAINKAGASQRVQKDYDQNRNQVAQKLASTERAKLVSGRDVDRGTRGILTKEFQAKAQGKEQER